MNFNRGSLFDQHVVAAATSARAHWATFTLEDEAGNPRQDVTIHYAAQMAVKAMSTTATDSNGQATFQRTRATAGTDRLDALGTPQPQRTTQGRDGPERHGSSVNFSLGDLFISGSSTGATDLGQPHNATVSLGRRRGQPRSTTGTGWQG